MNSTDVMNVIDLIAATGNRMEKQELVKQLLADALGAKVLRWAYDPFVTFGITPPHIAGVGEFYFDADTLDASDLFNGLAARRITGGSAKSLVEIFIRASEPRTAELAWRILSKDLRCGITDKTINLVEAGFIPTFTVMLAHKYEEKRIKSFPVSVEPKLDGVRVICLMRDGQARFFSRTGKPFPAVEHLEEQVVALARVAAAQYGDKLSKVYGSADNPSLVFDGEITSGNFNKTVGDVRRKSEAATAAAYTVFDVLPYHWFTNPTDKLPMTDSLRRKILELIFTTSYQSPAVKMIDRFEAASHQEIATYYERIRADGGEGVIVKPLDGLYEQKRSHAWLKIKGEETEDLRIVSAFEGEGKFERMLGGVHVDFKGVKVSVGGGFTDAERQELFELWVQDARDAGVNFWEIDKRFWNNPDPDAAEKLLTNATKLNRLTGRLVEVEFHEVTPDGSLRHPRFVKFRDDKDELAA